MPTDEEWSEMSGLAYVGPAIKTRTGGRIGSGMVPVRVDTAWALLRFFRTGEDWGTEEVKRQWAEEELRAFTERTRPKPRLVEP